MVLVTDMVMVLSPLSCWKFLELVDCDKFFESCHERIALLRRNLRKELFVVSVRQRCKLGDSFTSQRPSPNTTNVLRRWAIK
jgi:hypothetical protein